MSDEERTPQEIIERLRKHQEDPDVAYYAGDCLEEAADAIEELLRERDNDETRRQMKKLMEDLHEADATAGALAVENRRLRKERDDAETAAGVLASENRRLRDEIERISGGSNE